MATKKKKKQISINEKTIRLLSSAVLAIILWLFINGNSNDIVPQDINAIPVTFTNMEALQEKHLVLEDNRNYYVNLRVQGTDRSLQEINTNEITAEVDMKDIDKKGEYNPEIVIKGLSNSVILKEVNPSTLHLVVDNVIESEKNVEVITQGKPGNDNAVISATSSEKVQVTGAEDRIAAIDKIAVTANVNGLTEDTSRMLEVTPYDKDGNIVSGVECEPDVVRVNIEVGKTKTVNITPPTTTGDPQSGYKVTSVTVDPTQKMVGAKQEVLDTIQNIQIDPVDVSGANKAVTKEVTLKLPDGASFLDNGDKATVTVNIEPIIEKSFTISSIETRNVGQGLTAAKVKDSSVVVKLSGTATELNKLTADNIKAFVDLNGLGKGDQEVTIQISLPSDQIKSISPIRTTVTIE